MSDRLRLSIQCDLDGTAELFVEASVGGYAGASSAWFGQAELAELGHQLVQTYPLPADESIELAGGYWDASTRALEQTHVCLRFYPVGLTGCVACHVELATPLSEGARSDSQSSMWAEVLTTYEQLRRFGSSLVLLARGEVQEVVL